MSSQATDAPGPAVTITVRTRVNGRPITKSVPARLTLSDFLRDHLGLTGTHLGCEHGVCGACAVLLNGESVRSCLMLAVQADGAEVTTIEGLQDNPVTKKLSSAFSEHHALQCGFCTPGMLVSATELVEEQRSHPCAGGRCAGAIREAMSGNICRCTGYQGIVDAVLDVLEDESTDSRRSRS